jgi:hypothetical protein
MLATLGDRDTVPKPQPQSHKMSQSFLRLLLFTAVTLVTACDGGRERTNVLTARGEQEVVVMDFSAPFPLDPLPAGWYHRTF